MSKEKVEKEEQHAVEMDEEIAKVKTSDVAVVWKGMIKLAEEMANAGSWNLSRWHATLAKLTGEPVNTIKDPKGQ